MSDIEGHVWADELIETNEGILCHLFKGVICHWDPNMCDLDCPHFQLESVREWAFHMDCMYEDCTYLSHEKFEKDTRSYLKKLINLVRQWVPPEIRDSSQEATEK